MKNKKKAVIKFDNSSKLPIIFYLLTAVILSCLIMISVIVTDDFSFTIGKSLSEGDIDRDGVLSASDALYIVLKEKNAIKFNGAQIDAGDLNHDGVINNLDATLIIQYSSETSDKLGKLCVGNTKMEDPSAVKTVEINQSTYPQQDEEGFIRSGNSYSVAFSTSEDNIFTTATISNKWKTAERFYYQIDIVLRNNSGQYIGDRDVEIDFSNDVKIEKNWDCSVEDSDFGLNVTTQNNSYIPDGGMLKCGMIVSSPIELEIMSVS